MITVALLNDTERLYKPEAHHTLILYPGSESYTSLQNALAPLVSDLQNLKKYGFHQIGGVIWNVELFFSSDWKFLAICLGMNAANSNYFCPWCLCSKNDQGT